MLPEHTSTVARNLLIYLGGVALSVTGALGLVGAVDLSVVLGAVLFITGLALVLFVHESLGGPI